MKIHTLERTQLVERPLEEVFAFFERPENLAVITPPSLGFVILTPSPIRMQTGTLIDYSVKILGVRMHWTTMISEYQPPFRFVDIQLKGPYTFWYHTHTFKEVAGGTEVGDLVRYVLPMGPLGTMMHKTIVKRQLSEIFDFRAQVIEDKFRTTTPENASEKSNA